ncbi:haloacid dehalogenase-like hydrolase domain-containing protein 2 [Ischnura elegans]|uniref:haloacid dehalogenase-like hydrolase domain-containing protein 2 n=1 Tax=Ischnura elegans TaxID=197161 RepID=UPI001ED870F3|nr:haloacid dehalogenase-like hydrolase domain-containing protein 2 [Ischnura elegans]
MAARWKALKAVLIDLSGTVHIENDIIPGSIAALERLQKAGLAVRFVTNTTKESRSLLLSRLTNMGFNIKPEEVFTSLLAARTLVETLKVRPLLFLEDEALEDFVGIDTANPNAVVVGLAPSMFQYNKLNEAFRLLQGGAQLIAIHKSKYYRRGDGLALGPGPFVECLEYASGQKARVVGKPAPDFFYTALTDIGVKPEEAIMIGDDVQLDVGGALDAGLLGILVKTGKYREGDEKRLESSLDPSCVVNDFPAAVDFILKSLGSQSIKSTSLAVMGEF